MNECSESWLLLVSEAAQGFRKGRRQRREKIG